MSVPLLQETSYLLYVRISHSIPIESIGEKNTKSLGFIWEYFKKKKKLKWIAYRSKLSTEFPSLLSLMSAIVRG